MVSITLAVALTAINLYKTPLVIGETFLGCLLGTFLLDLDYFFYAYITDPDTSFSKTLRAFVNHKDVKNIVSHIYYNKSEVKDKNLNGVLFQIALGGITILAAASSARLLIKVFTLSAFANSIYKMAEYYFEGKSDEWFWALKNTPNKQGIIIYTLGLFAVLVYSIFLF